MTIPELHAIWSRKPSQSIRDNYLVSYDTEVGRIYSKQGIVHTVLFTDMYKSATTSRHISDFIVSNKEDIFIIKVRTIDVHKSLSSHIPNILFLIDGLMTCLCDRVKGRKDITEVTTTMKAGISDYIHNFSLDGISSIEKLLEALKLAPTTHLVKAFNKLEKRLYLDSLYKFHDNVPSEYILNNDILLQRFTDAEIT